MGPGIAAAVPILNAPFPDAAVVYHIGKKVVTRSVVPSADGRNVQPNPRRRGRVFPPCHGVAAGAIAVRPRLLALLLRPLRDRLRRRPRARRGTGETAPGAADEDRAEVARDRRFER